MLLNAYKLIKVFRAHVDMECRVGAKEMFWKMPNQTGTHMSVPSSESTTSFNGKIMYSTLIMYR